MKMGVYREGEQGPVLSGEFLKEYKINSYNNGLFGDIEPEKWQDAFAEGCRALSRFTAEVDAIALSGTTPGLTAIDGSGNALYPAILMLDQRSRKQAGQIIDRIGLEKLLGETGNMPVAGGCSLASMLWLKENEPAVYKKTAVFGHSNTFMCRWLTGVAAIDPSSASLMALYNTVNNDLNWNDDITDAFKISNDRLPRLMRSYESPGRLRMQMAREFGFRREPPVIIGGNDAVLAAYSVGVEEAGDVINVNGTCEISLVCLPTCFSSLNYNVRAHVVPGRWLTLYVMNAGGQAFEWFRELFCSEMSAQEFYRDFVPRSVENWIERQSEVNYIPFLMGSRYSLEPLKAQFIGLTRGSSREELLAAMVRGLCEYQREHLNEISDKVQLKEKIYVTGGAAGPELIKAKQRWMRDCKYEMVDQSSMRGAALLGFEYLRKLESEVS
jgi:sugar (pentulose or hexulose) kinase